MCGPAVGGTEAEQIRSGQPSGNSTAGQSIISGEHIDTSNLKGVPVDPTTGTGVIAGAQLHPSLSCCTCFAGRGNPLPARSGVGPISVGLVFALHFLQSCGQIQRGITGCVKTRLTRPFASTGIESSSPIGNFTLGQATRYIIAGITEVSAGDNCTIWVDEGVQCGGQARPTHHHVTLRRCEGIHLGKHMFFHHCCR